MTDSLQALLQVGAKQSSFSTSSRYFAVGTSKLNTADGKTIVYLQRRFVPPPERFSLLEEHTVIKGERLDNITAQYLGDPEQFWRICDANAVMNPDELTARPGSKIRITLPEGMPGVNYG
jgi:hypothetical protein